MLDDVRPRAAAGAAATVAPSTRVGARIRIAGARVLGLAGAAGMVGRARLSSLVGAALLAGCAGTPHVDGSAAARAARPAEAAGLVGRTWDARARRLVDEREVLERALRARYVLLGEVHDNPEHHALRARLLSSLIDAGRRPAIAMEQLDRDRQPAIDAALAGSRPTPDAVRDAAGAGSRGWDWAAYSPFVALAIDRRLPLIAANLSRGSAGDVARAGFAALGAERAGALALESLWTDALDTALRRQLVAGHCGMSPGPAIEGLVRAQRARDAVIAESLAASREREVVLLAGNEHVRRDWGVPRYLASYLPGLAADDVVVIGYVEVQSGGGRPDAYARSPVDASPVFDFVRFTPPAPRADHCETLRRSPAARSATTGDGTAGAGRGGVDRP